MSNGEPIKVHCKGCKRTFSVPEGYRWASKGRPRGCRCTKLGGPYVAPEGYTRAYVFVDPTRLAPVEGAADIRREMFEAREAWRSGIWTGSVSKPRELSKTSPKRIRLERRYDAAARAIAKLQKRCPHSGPLCRLSCYDEATDRAVEKHQCRECLATFGAHLTSWVTNPGETLKKAS